MVLHDIRSKKFSSKYHLQEIRSASWNSFPIIDFFSPEKFELGFRFRTACGYFWNFLDQFRINTDSPKRSLIVIIYKNSFRQTIRPLKKETFVLGQTYKKKIVSFTQGNLQNVFPFFTREHYRKYVVFKTR